MIQRLQIPYHPNVKAQINIKHFVQSTIAKVFNKCTNIPAFIRKNINIRRKITIKKSKTIGDIIINMRKFSAKFDLYNTPKCLCHHTIFDPIRKNTKRGCHHIIVGNQTQKYKNILHRHMKFQPLPIKNELTNDIIKTIEDFVNKCQIIPNELKFSEKNLTQLKEQLRPLIGPRINKNAFRMQPHKPVSHEEETFETFNVK